MKSHLEVNVMAARLKEMADQGATFTAPVLAKAGYQVLTEGSEGREFFNDVAQELVELRQALDYRQEDEAKAHALFTMPLANGQTFAHTPDQCNPLGYVAVLRAAVEALMEGKKLANPFILCPH